MCWLEYLDDGLNDIIRDKENKQSRLVTRLIGAYCQIWVTWSARLDTHLTPFCIFNGPNDNHLAILPQRRIINRDTRVMTT